MLAEFLIFFGLWIFTQKMNYYLPLFALLLLVGICAAQSEPQLCDITQNYGPQGMLIYNNDCVDLAYPYCTGSGICAECSPGKSCDTCDCPANFKCVQAQFNPVRNAAFCAPFDVDMYDRVCSADSDCAVLMTNVDTAQFDIAMQGTCISGLCKFCNRLSEVTRLCEQTQATNDQNACSRGSKAQGRACLTPDVWNSNFWPLPSQLPSDPYSYETSQWAEMRPCESRTPSPDPSGGGGSTTSDASTLESSFLKIPCVLIGIFASLVVPMMESWNTAVSRLGYCC
jgi:hypothetical protein